MKFAIIGHSGNYNGVFELPDNVSIQYYANLDETCYVPNDNESLNLVIKEMTYNKKDIHYPGNPSFDYQIEFHDSLDGIYIVHENRYDKIEIEEQEYYNLSDICNFLKQEFDDTDCYIYSIFCRGHEREAIGSFEDNENVSPYNWSTESQTNENVNLDNLEDVFNGGYYSSPKDNKKKKRKEGSMKNKKKSKKSKKPKKSNKTKKMMKTKKNIHKRNSKHKQRKTKQNV